MSAYNLLNVMLNVSLLVKFCFAGKIGSYSKTIVTLLWVAFLHAEAITIFFSTFVASDLKDK